MCMTFKRVSVILQPFLYVARSSMLILQYQAPDVLQDTPPDNRAGGPSSTCQSSEKHLTPLFIWESNHEKICSCLVSYEHNKGAN